MESSPVVGEVHRPLVLHIMTTTASHTYLRHDVNAFDADAVYAVHAGNPSVAWRGLQIPDAGRTTAPNTLVPLDVRRRLTVCCKGRGAVSILLLEVRCEWNTPWRGDYSVGEA